MLGHPQSKYELWFDLTGYRALFNCTTVPGGWRGEYETESRPGIAVGFPSAQQPQLRSGGLVFRKMHNPLRLCSLGNSAWEHAKPPRILPLDNFIPPQTKERKKKE